MTPPSLSMSGRAAARGADSATEAGRVFGITRAGVFVLLVLALANGVFLYLLPGRGETDYAWAIKPSINAACIGAGYLAGCVATALVVFRTRAWRSQRILPPALAVLAVTDLAATLIHDDRFRWDYAPTWLWTAVYVTVPLMVPVFWRLQERQAGPTPAADPRLHALRIASAALGAVFAAIGLALFFAPGATAEVWPWPVTPLLARVIASWYLLAATVLLFGAASLRRPHEVPIAYATLGAWSALLLALPAVYSDQLAGRSGTLAVWLCVHVALLVLCVFALRRTLPALSTPGERL